MRLTAPDIKTKKEKITVLTAYNYYFARVLDGYVDIVLVGDSLGNVERGEKDTLNVSMEDMIYHTKSVAAAVNSSMVAADMPFLSYQASVKDAVINAGKLLQAGADAVKIEGAAYIDAVKNIIRAGIPVMGHIGLTPQFYKSLGGFKTQGKDAIHIKKLFLDAKLLEDAGVFSIVFECIPEKVSSVLTKKLSVPTIGIGAGKYCSGQVLVLHDILGLYGEKSPKFSKKYADLHKEAQTAVSRFSDEVKRSKFPDSKHSFKINMTEKQIEKLLD